VIQADGLDAASVSLSTATGGSGGNGGAALTAGPGQNASVLAGDAQHVVGVTVSGAAGADNPPTQ
jgi:hypothetical protein